MNDFWIWFSTGLQHILDWNGYDHILYVVMLCILFTVQEWKKLLVLVTAFTVGHSLTLAFSAFDVLIIHQSYIEILIPLTIILTSMVNIYFRKRLENGLNQSKNYRLNYILALVFGFIHGMGFSYLLKSMLGKEENIFFPLISFNLGLEVGQLIIVAFTLLLSVFLVRFTRIKKPAYVFFISSTVFAVSFLLFIQRLNAL
ncbi:MAG: HupE/UreJ family protein [Bacteroidota bacterium]